MSVVAPPPVSSTTLGDLFEEIGTREPDAPAYVDGAQRLTYAQWLARMWLGNRWI